MIITCEKCSTKFNLDESILKKDGSKVRCSVCKYIFKAYPPNDGIDFSKQESSEAIESGYGDISEKTVVNKKDNIAEDLKLDSNLKFDDDLKIDDDFTLDDEPSIDKPVQPALETMDSPKASQSKDDIELDIDFSLDDDFSLPSLEDTPKSKPPAPTKSQPASVDTDSGIELDIDFSLDDDFSPPSLEDTPKSKPAPTKSQPASVDTDSGIELDIDFSLDDDFSLPSLEDTPKSKPAPTKSQPASVDTDSGIELDIDFSLDDDLDFSKQQPMPQSNSSTSLQKNKKDQKQGSSLDLLEGDIKLELDFDFSLDKSKSSLSDSSSDSDQGLEIEIEDDSEFDFDFSSDNTQDNNKNTKTESDQLDSNDDVFDEEDYSEELNDIENDSEVIKVAEKSANSEQLINNKIPLSENQQTTLGGQPIINSSKNSTLLGNRANLFEDSVLFEKSNRSFSIGKAVIIPLVLLIVLIGGYAASVVMGIRIPYISDITTPYIDKIFSSKSEPIKIIPEQKTISGKFITNTISGTLFVITGQVTNYSKITCKDIKVEGTLIDTNKRKIKNKTVLCGNVISDDQLKTLDMNAINSIIYSSDGNKKFSVEPGKSITFMVVFSDFPDNLENFTVAVTGFKKADEK